MADKTQIPDRVWSYATSDGSRKLRKGTVHPSLLEFNFFKARREGAEGNNKLKADILPSVVPHSALAGAAATPEPSASGHTPSASCP